MDIRINSYIPKTFVEGPGCRFCIWVQGCSIRCPGCANYSMWDSDGGQLFDTGHIINLISQYTKDIEGVTFLGGEPLDQATAVAIIAKEVRQKGLSVVVFTGYDYESVKDYEAVKELVKYTDILIDGRYDKTLQDFSRPWVGSSNQKFRFFSDRYNESILSEYKNKVEIRIDSDSGVVMNGMANTDNLKNLVTRL